MIKKDRTLVLRIEDEVLKEFQRICLNKDTTPSIQIRKAIKNYIENNKEEK